MKLGYDKIKALLLDFMQTGTDKQAIVSQVLNDGDDEDAIDFIRGYKLHSAADKGFDSKEFWKHAVPTEAEDTGDDMQDWATKCIRTLGPLVSKLLKNKELDEALFSGKGSDIIFPRKEL